MSNPVSSDERVRVAVVGAGSIGVGLAVVFARAGHEVALHDTAAGRLKLALQESRAILARLHANGLLDEQPSAVARRVTV